MRLMMFASIGVATVLSSVVPVRADPVQELQRALGGGQQRQSTGQGDDAYEQGRQDEQRRQQIERERRREMREQRRSEDRGDYDRDDRDPRSTRPYNRNY